MLQSPQKDQLNERLAEEFAAGKVLLFNKPLYWTSFDLVNKVKFVLKHRLHLKKIKVGHAGTLDPLATGLMIVCIGKETKNIELYQMHEKEYLAKIVLGKTTPSFDLETETDAVYPTEHINLSLVEQVLASFAGTQPQVPPVYSARMVQGKRAYTLARKGELPPMDPKTITISSIELTSYNFPSLSFRVVCSKGTYIRALARDIGLRLNSGAYLSELVRCRIGNFYLKDAMGIEDFERNFVFL